MRDISPAEAGRVIEILRKGKPARPIVVQPARGISARVDSVGRARPATDTAQMIDRDCLSISGDPIHVSGDGGRLLLRTGTWKFDQPIDDAHIRLQSPLFQPAYFSQLELSYCFADKQFLYLVKNVSKLAGPGAITRISNGAVTKQQKYDRLDELVRHMGLQPLAYNGSNWLPVASIKHADLHNHNHKLRDELFTTILQGLLHYALTVECIVRQFQPIIPGIPQSKAQDVRTTKNRKDIPETTIQQWVEARRGQSGFKKDLLRLWKRSCPVTQYEAEKVLRASHIKPWCVSTDAERLDPYNGILLSPNADCLFDKGLITFQDNGRILLSSSLPRAEAKKLGISSTCRIQFHRKHLPYLAGHRETTFRP